MKIIIHNKIVHYQPHNEKLTSIRDHYVIQIMSQFTSVNPTFEFITIQNSKNKYNTFQICFQYIFFFNIFFPLQI